MKYNILLLSLIVHLNSVAKINNDTSILVVNYSCNIDYLHRNNTPNYIGTLMLNTSRSYYFQEKNPKYQLAKIENDVIIKTNRKPHNHIVSKEFESNNIVFSDEIYMSKYFQKLILDNVHFDWTIFYDSTSNIMNYKCYLASTTFRGRNYYAWFTPEIKYKSGPWKFKDLPGLILKVYESNRDLTWEIISIERSNILMPTAPSSNINYQNYSSITKTFLQKIIRAQESNSSVDPLCSSCSQAKFQINIIESSLLK